MEPYICVQEGKRKFFASLKEQYGIEKPEYIDAIDDDALDKALWGAYRAWARLNLPLYLREHPRMGWLDVELPEGAVDTSWHNDAMSSWFIPESRVRLWIDYPNPEDREEEHNERFHLAQQYTSDGDCEHSLMSTDDWSRVLKCLAIRAKEIEERQPFVSVYKPVAGWKAILYAWDDELDQFVPDNTSYHSFGTRDGAEQWARQWAIEEELEYKDELPKE